MPKIIFQPLMISNPPGRLAGLRFWGMPGCYFDDLNPQMFLMVSTSWVSTFFSISSGRLQKKSMPVLSSSVLMFTT